MLDIPSDPLVSVVTLLKPAVSISKMVEAGGQWLVERHDMTSPFYCAVVEGQCQLHVTGRNPVTLRGGDFVLIPHMQGFTMSSEVPPPPHVPRLPLETGPGRFRLGGAHAPVGVRPPGGTAGGAGGRGEGVERESWCWTVRTEQGESCI